MASRYSYELTETAERDVDGIVGYLVRRLRAPQSASSLLGEMERRLDDLGASPQAGAPVDNPLIALPGVRKISIRRYVLYYVVDAERCRIVVVRVGRTMQDQDRLLFEL